MWPVVEALQAQPLPRLLMQPEQVPLSAVD
jgi:hypothetical protein